MEDALARVLAAIDVTHQARRVAERARIVVDSLGGDLCLLHVVEVAPEALLSEGVVDLIRRHQLEVAGGTAEWVRSRTNRAVQLTTAKGSPAWEIVRAGKNADLVVVGSSSVDSGRVGPVSRRVAEMSQGDVLVVKRQPRVPYRRVVAAVDLSEVSRRALDLAVRIAPEAEVTLVFALPTRFDLVMASAGMFPEEIDLDRKRRLEDARRRLEEFASGWADRGNIRLVVGDGPPLEVIGETIRRRSADLVVVGSRGAGSTRMVLVGTVAEGLLQAAPCDVAVARVSGGFRRP